MKNEPARNVLRRWLIACALGGFWLTSQAGLARHDDLFWEFQTPDRAAATFTQSPQPVPKPASPSANGAFYNGEKGSPWPAGKTAAANEGKFKYKAPVTARSMAKTLMNPVTGAATLLLAPLVKELLDQACVGVMGGTIRPGVVWDECLYTEAEADTYWIGAMKEPTRSFTPREACRKFSELGNFPGYQKPLMYGIDDNLPLCRIYSNNWSQEIGGYGIEYAGKLVTKSPQMECGPDIPGGCRQKHIPATSQEARDRVETAMADKIDGWCQADFTAGLQAGGKCAGLADALMDSGFQVQSGQPVITPPAPYPGNDNVTEVTNPDGSKTRTTTSTTHTISCDAAGVCTKTTTTTTKKETQASPGMPWTTDSISTDAKSDDRTACERDATSAACVKEREKNEKPKEEGDLDVPEGVVPKVSKELTFSAEDLGFGSGSCPQNVTQQIGGQSITIWNWQTSCGYVTTYVKPMILALSAWIAFLILMPGGSMVPGRAEA